jgi:hypothetical protein
VAHDLPPDPFLGDPEDLTQMLAALDEEDGDELVPLDEDERDSLIEDLAEIEVFGALLEPRGYLGLAMWCQDCEEDHYFSWHLLNGNLRHLMEHGVPRVHEPPFEPDPEDYVTMEYARGFTDGVSSLDEDL